MEILVVIALAIGLWKAWPYVFPERCCHGVAQRPGMPRTCAKCNAEREQRETELRRLEAVVERQREEARKRLEELRLVESENIRQLTYLQKMHPVDFERVVSHAYRNLGWEVQETAVSGDRGVDAFLRRDGEITILQCKRFSKSRVGTPVLRDLLGTVVAEGADRGIVVTTSSFSEDAISWANQSGRIDLIDGHRLLQIIAEAYPEESLVPAEFVTRRKHPSVVPSRCPWCGSKTKRRRGRRGPFYGCTSFPRCKWTMSAPGARYQRTKR